MSAPLLLPSRTMVLLVGGDHTNSLQPKPFSFTTYLWSIEVTLEFQVEMLDF